MVVKKFCKFVKIWQKYWQMANGLFFGIGVCVAMIWHCACYSLSYVSLTAVFLLVITGQYHIVNVTDDSDRAFFGTLYVLWWFLSVSVCFCVFLYCFKHIVGYYVCDSIKILFFVSCIPGYEFCWHRNSAWFHWEKCAPEKNPLYVLGPSLSASKAVSKSKKSIIVSEMTKSLRGHCTKFGEARLNR